MNAKSELFDKVIEAWLAATSDEFPLDIAVRLLKMMGARLVTIECISGTHFLTWHFANGEEITIS